MFKEFKDFAMRGNVIDLAVAVIIGGAFGKIVSSFVANIVTPLLGLVVGGVDFKTLKAVIGSPMGDQPPATIEYGIFIQNIFDFIIVAFAIFMAIRAMNATKKKEEEKPAAPAAPPKNEVLLEEIRDLLKK